MAKKVQLILGLSNAPLVSAGMTTTRPTLQAPASRLLYDRKTAAQQLSISIRSLDYLIAAKQLGTRRLGRKVMVPHGELLRFSRMDHTDDIRV